MDELESQKHINVLFLDDEVVNLQSYQASFRRYFTCYAASNAEDALDILKKHDINVLVCDQRMPYKTGVAFLGEIKDQFPDMAKILVTAYSDMPVIIEAVNQGELFRYFSKPYIADELKNGIISGYEMYKLRRDLKESNRALQKSLDDMEEFVYSVSHDLRSPLHSILGLIELLKIKPDLKTELIEKIQYSAHKLDTDLVKFVNYYKTRRKEMIIEPLDLQKIIKEILDSVYYLRTSDNIEIDMDMEKDMVVHTDKVMITSILNNIISNAVKYTDGKKASHKIHISALRNEQGNIIITVSDNGIGIYEQTLKRINEQLHYGANYLNSNQLGMTIVSNAARRLNAILSMDSSPGRGTTVAVSIPSIENPSI